MLELRLQSGQVVAFDGRVLEVFADGEPSRRFHIEQLPRVEQHESPEGLTVSLQDGSVTLRFAREEAPTCTRFLSALAGARRAVERPR